MATSSTAPAAAGSCPEMVDADRNRTIVSNGGGCAFAPSVWGDFFITYVPPPTQRSEEWMKERVEELKKLVRRMFDGAEATGVANTVTLVDSLEHLGLDSHFCQEIAAAIGRIHGVEEFAGSDDLHVVATRFRLLRQHGLRVSTDVFDKFRDGAGNFSLGSDDLRAALSLHHAAHMAAPGEGTLDEAITFARLHLQQGVKGELRSPAQQQVCRALDHPLPRFTKKLEAMYYIPEYAQEKTHDDTLLELARLNAHLMRSLHLSELKALSLWWRDLYGTVNLTYARDRMVETYFWSCGMIPEVKHSRGRLIFAKTFGLISILDDTFDVHATLEDCYSLNEAFQRWDESAVCILPEYIRALYIQTLKNFKEFEDLLEPHEKYRICYAKKAYQRQSEYYLQEAQWCNDKYKPSFEEHGELSALSTALPVLNLMALMGYDDAIASRDMFEWMSSVPDVVLAGAQIGRFLNDISAYKLGKNKKDMESIVECCMTEKGLTGEEAVAAIAAMTEHSWRVVNRACMEVNRALLPAVQLVASIARTCEVMYLHGRDGYTFGSQAKALVTALFLDPIPL